MKKSICLVSCLLALTLTSTFSQQPIATGTISVTPSNSQPSQSGLTKFNLDFPGGTPKQLVAAIEKATGKPLNVIVPDELAAEQLPALKMNDVEVSQLFRALTMASLKKEIYATSGNSYSTHQSYSSFKTEGSSLSDNSIWYFSAEKPPLAASPEKVSRFYSLSPYMESGYTVDDITTAIQTGWKMQGDTSPPQISFHKETKLLIAVGEPNKLQTIDYVLRALDTAKRASDAAKPKAAPAVKSTDQPNLLLNSNLLLN